MDTPRLAALRGEILPPKILAGVLLNEARALETLQEWLLRRHRPENRRAFGNYVRLMALRWGLPLTGAKQDSLHGRLLLEGLSADSEASLNAYLGVSRNIVHSFWEKRRRLEIALAFCRLTASRVLVELAGCPYDRFTELAPYREPEVMLLDSFYLHEQRKPARLNKVTMAHFGQYLYQQHIGQGGVRDLSAQLARKTGWKTTAAITLTSSSSMISTWKMLRGYENPPNMVTLPVIAKFAGMTVLELLEDYWIWALENPLDAT